MQHFFSVELCNAKLLHDVLNVYIKASYFITTFDSYREGHLWTLMCMLYFGRLVFFVKAPSNDAFVDFQNSIKKDF